MRQAMLVATMTGALSLAQIEAARAAGCDTLLHLHGYLTVATVRCGFTEDPNIIDAASTCRSQTGKASATKTATDGIRFAQGEVVVKGGTSSWCRFVKGQYPSLVSDKAR